MSTSLRLTIDDYEKMIANGAFVGLDRRLEFLDGEIREMSPAGAFHYDYIDFLTRWSTSQATSADANIQIQSAILLGNSMPEPDVMWLAPRRYRGQRPTAADALLVIEVADSSLGFDLGEKAALYATWGIADYWVVDVRSMVIHRHRQPQNGAYDEVRILRSGDMLAPICLPAAKLDLAELFLEEGA